MFIISWAFGTWTPILKSLPSLPPQKKSYEPQSSYVTSGPNVGAFSQTCSDSGEWFLNYGSIKIEVSIRKSSDVSVTAVHQNRGKKRDRLQQRSQVQDQHLID